MTSTFKTGTGGCNGHSCRDGWDPSVFCGGCGDLSGVFPTIFVLYLSDLPSEALSSTSTISSLTSWCHRIILTIF